MKRFLRPALVVALLAASVPSARAELTPDQVVIIGMAESEPSGELAKHYAKARGIPESHIFLIEGQPDQRITRYQWEETYRPAIRAWLRKQEFFAGIRCLVTTWDVPLEITPVSSAAPEITERVAYLRESRAALVRQLGALLRMLPSAGGQTDAADKTTAPIRDTASYEDLYKRFAEAMQPAQTQLRSAKTPAERQRIGQFVDRVLVTVSGNQGMLRLATPRSKAIQLTSEQSSRLAFLAGRAEGYQRGLQSLNTLRDTVPRDEQAIELVQAMGGLFGAIRWIDTQLYLLDKNYTGASFDSELSLVLWPDPPMLSWVSNPWHYSLDTMPLRRRTTLFVSRLSAPTPAIARRMIDDAIAAEKNGLQGTMYLDARAIPYDPTKTNTDLFARYEKSIHDLDENLRKHSDVRVVLDNRKELFEAGKCPEAALYCGWHSPSKYVDAFEWSAGAVAYHLASHEMPWLQLNDDRRVQQVSPPWCPALVADGACATLGSCREADLAAFPPPDDFFSLLLTGKYTLAEVYYRTCPFLSWTLVLVGDPLYNPFKNNPKLSPEALPERMAPGAARPAETKPAASPTGLGSTAPSGMTPRGETPSSSPKPAETTIPLPGLDP